MAKYPESPKFSHALISGRDFVTRISKFGGQPAGTFNEQRNRQITFPIGTFTLLYKNLLVADRNTVYAWWRNYHGAYGDSTGVNFHFFDQALRGWYGEYMGRGTGNALTLDFPGKTLTNDATLIVYEDDVAQVKDTDFTFVSGGGTEGADQATWIVGHYPAVGAMITCSFNGYLRIKARFAEDGWSEEVPTVNGAGVLVYNFQTKLQELQW